MSELDFFLSFSLPDLVTHKTDRRFGGDQGRRERDKSLANRIYTTLWIDGQTDEDSISQNEIRRRLG